MNITDTPETEAEALGTIAYCVVIPYVDRHNALWQITVPECPHCGKTHFHGGGPLTGPPDLGHRLSHCLGPKAPDNDGYVLVPIQLQTVGEPR